MGEFGNEYYASNKALKYNKRSYNINKDVHSEFALAKNYYLINDMGKSVPMFEDICRKSPDYTPYKGLLIMIYQELGREKNANKLLTELKIQDMPRYTRIIKANCKVGEHGIVWNRK
jgi:hypothetical protein